MKATFIALLAVLLCIGGCGESEAEKATIVKDAAEAKEAIEAKAAALAKESAKAIEAAIRKAAKKPTGELTKADLEKITSLDLGDNQLTDVKGLEKLTQLTELYLYWNQLAEVPKELEKLDQLRTLYLNQTDRCERSGEAHAVNTSVAP